jgi:glycosyltransferase involved in cell wall biosynthesis
MKIAQVSPLYESVPPKGYGGTERVISYLTEELVQQGHDVTLFASGDSVTSARLISASEQNLRQDMMKPAGYAYHAIQLGQVAELAHTFDVIHFHTDFAQLPVGKLLHTPHLTTLHGRLDLPYLTHLYQHFNRMPLISISDSQREPLPWANWCDTIPHGLPADLYSLQEEPGSYFLFLGRVSPEKRVDRAIDIAQQCGVPLYIGAKIDAIDEAYFNACVKPLLSDPLVRFLGEVTQQEKRELLEHASALLFPIDWPEPFGLVMIEAFCCGTPVIAYRHGSVPEVMEDGVTGFVVSNQDEAVRAARNIGKIDRRRCREVFERRFTAAHMAENYLRAYQRVLSA